MDDLISRRQVIDAIKERYYKYGRFAKIEELVWSIENLPSEQPEREKGAWINEGRIIRCNRCKIGYAAVKGMKSALTYKFCPNCGADMRGGNT